MIQKMDALNALPVTETTVVECGGDSTPHQPPTMSVNLNAAGEDSIASLLKLLVKVNPDMMPPEDSTTTSFSSEPAILQSPSQDIKLLPTPRDMDGIEDGELDHDEDEGMLGAIAGGVAGAALGGPMGALTGAAAGDSLTGEDTESEDGGFQDASTEPDEEYQDTDYMLNKNAGGLNKPKQMNKHSYKQGDNPMAMPESTLESQIRDDLRARLSEAKLR